jgi:hypothetical protein
MLYIFALEKKGIILNTSNRVIPPHNMQNIRAMVNEVTDFEEIYVIVFFLFITIHFVKVSLA